LNEIVGLIHDVNFHPEDKTVSLDDITFVETQAGKDVIALAEARMPFQVSQRGDGKSHLVKGDNGIVSEVVDSLSIDGWDVLRSGKASVANADMEFQVLTEEAEMPDRKILTEEEVDQKFSTFKTEVLNEIKTIMKPEAKPAETPKPEPKNESVEVVTGIQKQLNEQKERIAYYDQKEGIEALSKVGTTIINETLGTDTYKRFTADQKKALLESVSGHIPEVYGKIDVTKPDDVKKVITYMLNEEITVLDKYIAVSKLNDTGYPNRGTGNGIQSIEVIRAEIPNGQRIKILEEQIDEVNDPDKQYYKLPAEHRFNKVINEVMDNYYRQYYRELLNEASEEFTQDHIGATIRSINAAIIPAAMKRLTATRYCNVFTMKNLREDILIESLLPALSTNVHTNVALLQPTESGSLTAVGSTLSAYAIIATEKGFTTQISAKAIATGKNTPVDPVALAVASISKQAAQIMDQYIWEWIIARAQAYSKAEVTDYEVMTRVGATNEHQSVNQGWIKYECYRDTTSANPTDAKLVNLFGTPVGSNTYQPVVAREHDGDNTALTHVTDYTINWADGSITLTTAGAAKCAGNEVEIKYSYTTNAYFWSVSGGGTGVTLYDWLLNLQQQVGKAKVSVRNRGYEPNFAITDISVEDLISKGPQFTNMMSQNGNIKDAFGNVTMYDGLPLDRAGWLPSGWALTAIKGTATAGPQYGIHTPMMIDGPIKTAAKSFQDYNMTGFDGIDYPNNAEMALVGITDLAAL
jgi:hypothetical protein